MYYEIKPKLKKNLRLKGKKMNLRAREKNNALRQSPVAYPKSLTFFPIPEQEPEDICQNINKNLFKLEKDIAYFSFAIKEIKDITYL